jgi:RNase P subunit RPR2
MTKKKRGFVAVYCQECGYIDENVSEIAIDVIRRVAQTEDVIVDCRRCGAKITVNLTKDTMKVGKNGKIKLPETTRW